MSSKRRSRAAAFPFPFSPRGVFPFPLEIHPPPQPSIQLQLALSVDMCIFIVSASRSPPGLCSNLRSSVRVPNEYTFRVTFRIIFGPFGIIFEACLGPWGHFGGAVGSLFASKISLGLQRWPKKRLPRNPLTLLETFWSSFFEYFRCFC